MLNGEEFAEYIKTKPFVAITNFLIHENQSISGKIISNSFGTIPFRGKFSYNKTNTYHPRPNISITIEPQKDTSTLKISILKNSKEISSAIAQSYAHPHNSKNTNNPENLGEVLDESFINVKFSHKHNTIPENFRGKGIATAKIKKFPNLILTFWIIVPPNGKPTIASSPITNNYQIHLFSQNPKIGTFLSKLQLQKHHDNPFHPHINPELCETLWLHRENKKGFFSILNPIGSVRLAIENQHYIKIYEAAKTKALTASENRPLLKEELHNRYIQDFTEMNFEYENLPVEIQNLLKNCALYYRPYDIKKDACCFVDKSYNESFLYAISFQTNEHKILFSGKLVGNIWADQKRDFIFENIKNKPFAIKVLNADRTFENLDDFEGLIELPSGKTYPIKIKNKIPDKSTASELHFFRIEKPVKVNKPDNWPWIWDIKLPRKSKGVFGLKEFINLSVNYVRPKELFPLENIKKTYSKAKRLLLIDSFKDSAGNIHYYKKLRHNEPQIEDINIPPQDNDYTREINFITCINQARMNFSIYPLQIDPDSKEQQDGQLIQE